ncbi:hypothetical protein ACE1BS_24640 [Aeromonas jandaei]
MKVTISNLFRVSDDCKAINPNYILMLLDPDVNRKRIPIFPKTTRVHKLFFYDDDDLNKQMEPLQNYIIEIIEYLKTLYTKNQNISLIINCHAGASRSPAAAYILFLMQEGHGGEPRAFERLLDITNKPWPNREMIRIADELLKLDGKALVPLDNYRKNHPKRYLAYRKLNKYRDL